LSDERQNLVGSAEGAVRCQENVDVGRFQFTGVRGQALDQLFQRASFNETDTDRFPLQVGNLIFRILRQGNACVQMGEQWTVQKPDT
jgi:hypothetical protein